MSSTDLLTVYDFIKATGETNIRKMMTGGKMTQVHVGLLLKIVRSCTAEDFVKHGEGNSFPKMKTKNEEDAIKETFWQIAAETFKNLGLVTTVKAA